MKLLVINLQNPGETKCRNPKTIGVFMWGRSLDNYPMFILNDNGELVPIVLRSAEIGEIQKAVDEVFRI